MTDTEPHVLATYSKKSPVFVRGQGARQFDAQGKAWIDMLSGIGVTSLGHAHPGLTAALQEQAGQLLHVSNLFRHEHSEPVAAELCRLTGMGAVFFSNSGSEAGECALKLARKAQRLRGNPGRSHFVALEGGFHGRTMGSLSLTANPAYREPFGPGLQAEFIPRDDLAALEAALQARAAALILEPIQGEGGVHVLSESYLRAAQTLCDSTGTLLIHDEVQCGGGRTGRFLAAQHAGVTPDLVTLAKPLGAGVPIGATLVAPALCETLVPGDHGSTFGGGPLALRAARVMLGELAAGLQETVVERGAALAAGLDGLAAESPYATGRRGLGLMQGLVVPGRANEVAAAAFERGLIVGTATGDVVRLLPPYVLTEEELGAALTLLAESLNTL